jgi:aspartyl-tRNA(Asn)/glutamyl-tRNA(Gln) amidotransferase subunit C
MSLNKKDIEHIAKLAKLKFTDDEIDKLAPQLNGILDYVEKLNELDTENVEPLSHPVANTNVFREDKLKESVPTEEALKNAPQKDEKYFKVPKVINVD